MVQNDDQNVNDNGYFLSEISEKDKNWDDFKKSSINIANALQTSKKFATRAYELQNCAEYLVYAPNTNPENLDRPLLLREARFCRDRACPVCNWRRSLRWKATMHRQIPHVAEKYPTHRWIFLTLTVQNCHIADLRTTIDMMNKGFTALFRKLKKLIGDDIGYVKTIEVTRSRDDKAHPHFHVMLLVPASYFGKKYLVQSKWVELWRSAAKLSYDPVVDVRAIHKKGKKTQNASDDDYSHAVAFAVAETVKYSVKSADLLRTPKNALKTQNQNGVQNLNPHWWLLTYFEQVKNLRFISVGGVLKGLIKPEWTGEGEDKSNLIYVNNEEEQDPSNSADDEIRMRFDFNRDVEKYWFH